jgi:hypothetical protein
MSMLMDWWLPKPWRPCIELGITLSDDLEIVIQTEKHTVALFGSIEIGDVYGYIKGSKYEMTFHQLKESARDANDDLVMPTRTGVQPPGTFNTVIPQPEKPRYRAR